MRLESSRVLVAAISDLNVKYELAVNGYLADDIISNLLLHNIRLVTDSYHLGWVSSNS